jgi:hypothetical protein
MSELSEKLAPYSLRAKANQSRIKHESRDEVLDKGWKRYLKLGHNSI